MEFPFFDALRYNRNYGTCNDELSTGLFMGHRHFFLSG